MIEMTYQDEPGGGCEVVVVDFAGYSRAAKDRPAPLSDAEILRLRALLENFDKVAACCPIAKRAML